MLSSKILHWNPYSQCMNLWSLIVHKFLADKKEDLVLNKFPAIFLMDCTLNDCGLFLKPLGKVTNLNMPSIFRYLKLCSFSNTLFEPGEIAVFDMFLPC